MTPKNNKDLVKSVSEELNLSEELVYDVTGFYWKLIKKEVDEFSDLRIEVKGLGNFKARKNKINSLEKKYKIQLKKFENYKHNKNMLYTYNKALKKLEDLSNLRKKFEEYDKKRESFKLKKEQYEYQKNNKK
jgi:nucleoid DNA-binding protein